MPRFKFIDSGGSRSYFVASKWTILLVIDLKTGRINNAIYSDPLFEDQRAVEQKLDSESDQIKKSLVMYVSPTEVLIERISDYYSQN